MADFSHCRLKDTLTKIAIHETDIADTSQLFTSAFLDAWSIVDGKLYLNYDKSVQADWEKDKVGYIKKADDNYQKKMKKP